jgi:surface protein
MATIHYFDAASGTWKPMTGGSGGGTPGPQGQKGDKGDKGDAGADGLGFTPVGEWVQCTDYNVRDVVTHKGASYVLVATPGDACAEPGSVAGEWELLANAGAEGPSEPSRDGGNSITKGSDGLLFLNLTEWRVLADGSLVKIDPDALVLVFDTSLGTAASRSIGLRLSSVRNPVNVVIDWGDGETDEVFVAGPVTHEYAKDGRYVVSITGSLDHFGVSNAVGGGHPAGFDKLYQAVSWGNTGLVSLERGLRGARFMDAPLPSIPPSVTNLAQFLQSCESFNQPITNLDTTNVTTVNGMFSGCLGFNQTVTHLRTSNVTDFGSMFSGCANFNQSVAGFDTAKATNMASMFANCAAFNRPVATLKTSLVASMSGMFSGCSIFNQPVAAFVTANVVDFGGMFRNCAAFNQPVASFDTSKATSMAQMFQFCTLFNQTVPFNTANVTDMSAMFQGCAAFNRPVPFNTAKVMTMASMFAQAIVFDGSVSSFDTSAVKRMDAMFAGARAFNQPVATFNTAGVVNMGSMFDTAFLFNRPVPFNTANVTNMSSMFSDARSFNQSVATFDTGKVTTMERMFRAAGVFNQSVATFSTAAVTTMASMFEAAAAFNQTPDTLRFTSLGAGGLVNFLSQATAFTTANYDALLAAWRNQLNEVGSTMRRDHRPTAAAKYSATAAATRTELQTAGWVITDGGQV